MFPSCTHREPSASFAASGVKTQACANRGPRVHLHGGHGMLDHPGRH